jgi:hypothetical protein
LNHWRRNGPLVGISAGDGLSKLGSRCGQAFRRNCDRIEDEKGERLAFPFFRLAEFEETKKAEE